MIGSQRKPMADSTRGGRGRSLLGGGLAKKRRMGSALFGARTGSGRPLESEAPDDSEAPVESEAPIESEAPVESEAPGDSGASERVSADPTPAVVDGAAFVAAIGESPTHDTIESPPPEIASAKPASAEIDPPSGEQPPADPPSWSEFDMLSIADDPSWDDMVSIPTPQPETRGASAPTAKASGGARWALWAVILLVVGGLAAWWWIQVRPTADGGLDRDTSTTVSP